MATKTPKRISTKALIRKLRKPPAPPTRVIENERKYKRAREQERIRRDESSAIVKVKL